MADHVITFLEACCWLDVSVSSHVFVHGAFDLFDERETQANTHKVAHTALSFNVYLFLKISWLSGHNQKKLEKVKK